MRVMVLLCLLAACGGEIKICPPLDAGDCVWVDWNANAIFDECECERYDGDHR